MVDSANLERVLAATRAGYGAPPAARERLRNELAARGYFDADGAAPLLQPPAEARAAGVSKTAAALLAGVTFVAGIWLGNRWANERVAPSVPAGPPATSAVSATPLSLLSAPPPSEAPVVATTSEPASPVTEATPAPAPALSPAKRNVAPRATKPPARSAANTELILLQRAERAIRGGEPELALSFLAELERSHPQTQLREERNAASLMARCAHGDAAAKLEADRFLREHRASVYSDRVRELCGVQR